MYMLKNCSNYSKAINGADKNVFYFCGGISHQPICLNWVISDFATHIVTLVY